MSLNLYCGTCDAPRAAVACATPGCLHVVWLCRCEASVSLLMTMERRGGRCGTCRRTHALEAAA